jgi:hypothetical protein
VGSNYFVSPAPGRRWDLSLEDVANAFRARWPDVVLEEENRVPGRTVIGFMFQEGGRNRLGSYFTVPGECLVLDGSDIDVVPSVVSWFLGLTPRDVPSITYTPSNPDPTPLPAGGDEIALRKVYQTLD